jgi:hypothetical protein
MKEPRMLSCSDAAPLIARLADGASLEQESAHALDGHLSACAACRALLDEQRLVLSVLRSRPAENVSPAFASRLAARLDDEIGFFGIADWRAWTFRLAPAAAAAALVAVLLSSQGTAAPISLEEWAVSNADTTSRATLLWDSDTTADAVLETMLMGDTESTGGTNDVR